VYAAALGCVSAMIELQFKRHMEECENCREEYKDVTLNLSDVVRSNFDHYYGMELKQAVIDQQAAAALVKSFFNKGKHT
jgi:iron only hydrogenase large subunit-like protein